jgi:hypothetical protein
MALPLITVPNWVPNVINPCILFITENYPGNPNAANDNTYFYRTLNPFGSVGLANNLLNNLCTTLEIIGFNEQVKLNEFMFGRNYFLIDTFPSGQVMSDNLINSTLIDIPWIDAVIDDIIFINPEQIIFTCVGSNGRLLPVLIQRAIARGLPIFGNIVHPPFPAGRMVFHSPSNRAYPTFHTQILGAIAAGTLTL